ncbi:MAG: hypothetical protein ABW221_02945, partial [Vicinamibacteria bacterium]
MRQAARSVLILLTAMLVAAGARAAIIEDAAQPEGPAEKPAPGCRGPRRTRSNPPLSPSPLWGAAAEVRMDDKATVIDAHGDFEGKLKGKDVHVFG